MSEGHDEPVYRPHRARGMDEGTSRLALIAFGIGAVLLVVIGGWSLAGHHAGGIPVIEPEPGPIKVKPLNPGGLQVEGALAPPANADNGAPSLAPGPEKPDPAALQAQLAQARKDSVPEASAPQASAPPPATPPAVAAASSPPAETSSPVPPHAAPAPGPSSAPPTGVQVQLAALDTEEQARAAWARLQRQDQALFADRAPLFMTASRAGRRFVRLRIGGFATIADASTFCARVRAAGAACTIATF